MTETITMRDRYLGAPEFGEMLATATKNADLWAAVWRRATVPDEFVQRVAALGGARHLLVLSEDWCGDAVNTVPVVARLAELAPNVDLRVLARDENLDLMDAHLTGTSRSIPVVIALDEEFTERGWWGPRPMELQRWVLGPGQALDKDARYREIRSWYARDKGRATLEEVVGMMEDVGRSGGRDVRFEPDIPTS
jgi:thioredoxin family protein